MAYTAIIMKGPKSYKEAMSSNKTDNLRKAMKEEMDSLTAVKKGRIIIINPLPQIV